MTAKQQKLSVLGSEILIKKIDSEDFLSLTDIAKYKNNMEPDQVVRSWLRNKNTIEFLGLREQLNNPNFNPVEFDRIRNQAGLNAFTLSVGQWKELVGAIGLESKTGRYGGGTYAHKDIALEFASRVSVEVKLYLVKDYQRLKEEESQSLERNVKRLISKTNYRIHTDAIKETIIPQELTSKQVAYVYADEADMLNVALFGQTAKERRDSNANLKGNMRDYATIEQLIVLSNMESINAELIRQHISQSQRLEILNKSAIQQMKSLVDARSVKSIKALE